MNLFALPQLLHARELNLNLFCSDRFPAKPKVQPSFLGLCWHPPISLCLGKNNPPNTYTFVISILGDACGENSFSSLSLIIESLRFLMEPSE